MVSLNIKVDKHGYCVKCSRKKDKNFLLNNKLLPLWYLDNEPQFHIPVVLARLSYAEKMLIQRVSPFIPLHHIKCGIFGLSGHTCAFEQDITGMAVILPLMHNDVRLIRVLQAVKGEIGSTTTAQVRPFIVRRVYVIDALVFLKKFNREYTDITIDPSRLNWIDGDEGELQGQTVQVENMKTNKNDSVSDTDMGPAPPQCIDPRQKCHDVQTFGYIDEGGIAALSPQDAIINKELQDTVAASPRKADVSIDWPATGSLPISEYDNTRIFARAFPWLFPGGYGDIKDFANPEQNMNEWGKRLLYYEDARFATDKIFVFFAMNYIIRHRNSSSGRFFIDKFQRNVPDTLSELQETIKNGDTSFVNNITYWNKRIKGSSPYWHQKRSELYTWISQHIEMGNGPPTFFITLSCAEYFWPDVIDLLRDRLKVADIDDKDCYEGSPKLIQLVNDHSIVIQEYFQKRTIAWLETVGKEILDIKHYWVRYEFAPGRGQIHAHLLAIPNNHDIYEACNRCGDNPDERAKTLSNWANSKFGLTASVDDDFDDLSDTHINPVTIRFHDVLTSSDDDEIRKDGQRLLHKCELHQCSGFCMRQGNENK